MKKDLLAAVVVAVVASAAFVGILAMQKPIVADTDDQSDTFKLKGHVTLVLRDEFGNIKDYREIDNIIVTAGIKNVSFLTFSGNGTTQTEKFAQIKIGDSSTAAAIGQTALQGATLASGTDSAVEFYTAGANTNKTRIDFTFGAGVGTGTVRESGVFNTNATPVMLARQTFADIVKNASDSLTVTWDILLK